MNGGERVARVLVDRGIGDLFTLCGGHISPILVSARRAGIAVTDVRHEAAAVFAADAWARLTGRPGVAAVTAGPGLTNAVTAVKNAQLAQSPVLVLGGATATALKGRGALQDIEQLPLMTPHVKFARAVRRARDLAPAVADALDAAVAGVPGPVFVECPVDLLYDESVVRGWYEQGMPRGASIHDRVVRGWLELHLRRLMAGGERMPRPPGPRPAKIPPRDHVREVARLLGEAERPLLVCGSQALSRAKEAPRLREAVDRLGIPVYLSGMARGLLGRRHRLLMRHHRRDALKAADLVLLAGVPCDFRLDYGRQIRREARLVACNLNARDLRLNRRPDHGVLADPAECLCALAELDEPARNAWPAWLNELRVRDQHRDAEIARQAGASRGDGVNALRLCREIDAVLPDNGLVIADGGDFVGTAAYVVRPPGALRWLDPGAFGTLGVGGGFALGAARARPHCEIWILYGDGSVGFSLAEFDSFTRHGIAPIAIVGNDACWTQIAREQVKLLGDDTAVRLARTDYHQAAEGLGAAGLLVTRDEDVAPALARARKLAAQGRPVLVNVHLAPSEFRAGSLSI